MTEYRASYKCRLCGKVYYAGATSNYKIALQAAIDCSLHLPNKTPQTPTITDVHTCENGSIGVSDFLGFVKHEGDEDNKIKHVIDTNGPKNLFLALENDSDVYEWLKRKIDELENRKGISTEYIQSVKSAFEDLKEGDIESAVNLLCAIMQKE